MSNVAGKAFAMNLITPIKPLQSLVSRFLFFLAGTPLLSFRLKGLVTLSMIHYARWVVVSPRHWPRLDDSQPKEDLRYAYQLFFSNFNGSWAQYVDSFSVAIPNGLNTLWYKNVGWPTSVPEQPFHRYAEHNQVWTNHYYSAYPMAASNDVKAARDIKNALSEFVASTDGISPEEFERQYNGLLNSMQGQLAHVGPTPTLSVANQRVQENQRARAAGDSNV